MITKTVRSRFPHEVGDKVEGCTIVEKRVIIPPDPKEMRRGVYDYVVEVPPMEAEPRKSHSRTRSKTSSSSSRSDSSAPEQGSYTRATPEEMASQVIRRLPSR